MKCSLHLKLTRSPATAALAAGLLTQVTAADEPLTPALADEVARAVQPAAGESAWLEGIPWETDLWEARRKAAAAGKPVFLWEMDGHPLGCT